MSERPGLRFGRVAEDYERVRPGYPATLVGEACERAGLRPQAPVVEIGCGTGKLTRDLVARGLVVDAVEPDTDLVEVARRVVPASSVRFHIETFEAVELPLRAFEAVFAATSFHWVDPSVGWAKVAGLLRPKGVFALLSHVGGLKGDVDEELVRVWKQVSPDAASWKPVDDETLWRGAEPRMGNVSELWSWLTHHDMATAEASLLFEDVRLTRLPFEFSMSVKDYLARIRTSNAYLHLTTERQHQLVSLVSAVIQGRGGTYHSTEFATLVTARVSAR